MVTSTPAIQCDYIPARVSLTLPRELVERTFRLLDTTSILTCRLVNREFNEIIQSSTVLQYFLACKAAGVIDNPRSSLSYGERLKALWKREDAWRMLKPVFETTIKVNHPVNGTYDLTEGVFFHDDENLKDLQNCQLPSSPQDNPRWNRIPGLGPGEGSPGLLANFGTAVYEHDLIINVIVVDIGNQADTQWYSIDLVLLKYSTGEYHPLARHPRIHVQKSPEAVLQFMSRIVGDHLALIVQSLDDNVPDKLFIFDWKTGCKRLQHETTGYVYSESLFLSPEILLVPNLILSHFEVWHLPPSNPSPRSPVQILALQIPAISHDYSLIRINCHGAPNPFLHSMPYFPPRPFFPSPANSIISADLYLESHQPIGGVISQKSCTIVMPRRAFLDVIQKWTSPSLREQLEDLPMWLTNEVALHKIVDPDDDGSVRVDAQSKLVSMLPRPSSTSADSGSSSISSGSSTPSSTTQYNFPRVRWADWGPPISRWFLLDNQLWIWCSTGQRFAFLSPHPHDRSKEMLSVADFNQHNFPRTTDMMAPLRGEGTNRGANDNHEKGNEKVEEGELERFDHEGAFSEDVYMGLKCVVYHASGQYDFDGVFMDEERLLGLKVSTRKWH
ncbi:hypothetical protein M378DRAFT_648301 [Amanita muscaria Koide BX008]|uniref:F-box domain-containing protein n=1 Tax=Amanita muscaria (strain Koide BX008) TaxID=946122 RepID=A0A0C2X5E5_AMAMK|nr:hypothetical protein M378DRAFT_648301 [Amanita muscaria Koide BX008]